MLDDTLLHDFICRLALRNSIPQRFTVPGAVKIPGPAP
jgi:hypothetical protein